MSAPCPKFDMVWLYRSPIPVGRRRVISSLKWFLPASLHVFERGGEGRHPLRGIAHPCCLLSWLTVIGSRVAAASWSLKSCLKFFSHLFNLLLTIFLVIRRFLKGRWVGAFRRCDIPVRRAWGLGGDLGGRGGGGACKQMGMTSNYIKITLFLDLAPTGLLGGWTWKNWHCYLT